MFQRVSSFCEMKNLLYNIKRFRVEPIAFLYFFSMGIFGVMQQVGTYRVICYHTIGDDPRFSCAQLGKGQGSPNVDRGHNNISTTMGNTNNSHQDISISSQLEIKVQRAASTWQLIFQMCFTIPALFADAILGALGDKHGRKMNILIGLIGSIISVFPFTIIFSYKTSPLFILIISNLISGLTGSMTIISISCHAYLSDTVVDPNLLAVRMTYFSMIITLPGIISPLIGNVLLNVLSYAQTALICQASLVVVFFLTLLIVQPHPPLVMRKMMTEKYIEEHGHPPPTNEKYSKSRSVKQNTHSDQSSEKHQRKGLVSEIGSIIKQFFILLKEVFNTYTKQRPSKGRMYLLLVTSFYLLDVAFETGIRSNVFTLFVQKSPFSWGASELGTYRSVTCGVYMLGSIVGAFLLKKILKFSDTTLILIAMGSNGLTCALFAFSKSTAMIYLAITLGFLYVMIAPCIFSFMSQLIEPDEVGKAYSAFGVASSVAVIISQVLYSSVYRATVAWFAGFVFLLAVGLQVLCMVIFFWLHVDYHYDGSIMNCLRNAFRFGATTELELKANGVQNENKCESSEIPVSEVQ